MNPDISVVVTTFQQPAQLLKCLDALERQSLPRHQLELIIVDDGDSPTTATAVALFARQLNRQHGTLAIRYLPQSIRQGLAAARNRGWQAARGSVIAFLNDDILPCPDWLASALSNETTCITGPVCSTPASRSASYVYRKTTLDQLGGFPETGPAAAPICTHLPGPTGMNQQALPVYWVAISGALTGLMGVLTGVPLLATVGFGVWLLLSALFGQREQLIARQRPTLLTQITTRLTTPFVSVYWQLYSTFKYGVAQR